MIEEQRPQDTSDIFKPQDLIDGRYTVVKLIGSGGMGQVYLVKDRDLDEQELAIKILHRDQVNDPSQKQRFLREVELTRKINHVNIVRTFDVGIAEDLVYFTMEYIPGKTVEDLMEEGLKRSELADLIIQICEGLDAIHNANIFHRDLKPGNIIVLGDGTAKITDFGIARPEVSNLTAHNEIIGSIYYMAPEIWLGKKLTPSIDLYSLGVMLYELCTGMTPYDGDAPAELMRAHLEKTALPPKDINSNVPPWLNKLVLRLLEKSPLERPRNAREIIDYVKMHTGQAKDKSGPSTSGSADFIIQLEEESKRATKSEAPAADTGESKKESSTPSVTARQRAGATDGPLAGHLLRRIGNVFWVLVLALAIVFGLHFATRDFLPSALELSFSLQSEDIYDLTHMTVLKSGAVHGLILVMLLAIPGALVAFAAGSARAALRCGLFLMLYNIMGLAALVFANAAQAFNAPIVHSSAMLKALVVAQHQLTALALLSPAWVKHQFSLLFAAPRNFDVSVVPVTENPLMIFLLIIYGAVVIHLVWEAVYEIKQETGLAHTAIGIWVPALVLIESCLMPSASTSISSHPSLMGVGVPRDALWLCAANWLLIYLTVAVLTRPRKVAADSPPSNRIRVGKAKV